VVRKESHDLIFIEIKYHFPFLILAPTCMRSKYFQLNLFVIKGQY
jgi:hypothetical protein